MSFADDLAELSSCHVSDALAALGLPAVGLPGILPLQPGRRIVGPAMTVAFELRTGTTTRIEYLDEVQPGDVVVIANGGARSFSAWGGQRSLAAAQRGAVGTVIDGAYRDVEEHIRLGYSVYGRSPCMAGSKVGPTVPAAVNVPVLIDGTLVSPGDWVVGDASGVITVPPSRVGDVLEVARTIASQERQTTADVADGVDFMAARAKARSGSPGAGG